MPKSWLRGSRAGRQKIAELRERQQGRCGICGRAFGESVRECVDHIHGTKHVRGLLCLECNLALGFLEKVAGGEPIEDLLDAVAVYLAESWGNCSGCGGVIGDSDHPVFRDGPKFNVFCFKKKATA